MTATVATTATPANLLPNDPEGFEKMIALLCQQQGYEAILPPANTKGYDIELRRNNECIAVQVKRHKAKSSIAQLQKFESFLALPIAERFTAGWFISASGFSKPALTYVETECPTNFFLGTFQEGKIVWEFPMEESPPDTAERPLRYIGVFTCKGGVGKTTVAAHLAGAFALMGHDVILLDLDPDRNLRKLFLQDFMDEEGDASLYVPPKAKGQAGATITVLNHDEWEESAYPDIRIVICDCSPVLSENPKQLVEKFDYCIVPTTLNPLGVAKNADVITRTFRYIRQANTKAELFTLINSYNANTELAKRNTVLIDHLQRHLTSHSREDAKCHFIHPDMAKIRHSTALLYWGYHIVDGSKPQLAFQETGGRSYPRADFLQLAEYLENHTDLESLRDD